MLLLSVWKLNQFLLLPEMILPVFMFKNVFSLTVFFFTVMAVTEDLFSHGLGGILLISD